jgi:hypothetical protein
MASNTAPVSASRLPVMSADAIAPVSPFKVARMRAVDGVAKSLDGCCEREPQPRRRRRRTHRDPARCQPGRADSLKVEFAGEIVSAGPKRGRRRVEPRLQGNEGADRRRRALADRDANALRPVRETLAFHGGDAQHDAVAALKLLPALDEARETDSVGGAAENDVIHEARLDVRGCKSGGDGRDAQQNRKSDRPRPREKGEQHGRQGDRQRDPPDGFTLRREVKHDAKAESDR